MSTAGNPAGGVQAIQLEMAWSLYMDETSPYTYREERARAIRPILREQLEIAQAWSLRAGRQPGRRSGV